MEAASPRVPRAMTMRLPRKQDRRTEGARAPARVERKLMLTMRETQPPILLVILLFPLWDPLPHPHLLTPDRHPWSLHVRGRRPSMRPSRQEQRYLRGDLFRPRTRTGASGKGRTGPRPDRRRPKVSGINPQRVVCNREALDTVQRGGVYIGLRQAFLQAESVGGAVV